MNSWKLDKKSPQTLRSFFTLHPALDRMPMEGFPLPPSDPGFCFCSQIVFCLCAHVCMYVFPLGDCF
jgi:hypothetical protein